MNKWYIVFAGILALVFASCPEPDDSGGGGGHYLRLDYCVREVEFAEPTATVHFYNLNGNDIYLVKVNVSDFSVDAADTGGAADFPPGATFTRNNAPAYAPGEELPRMGHPAADAFHANPPPLADEPPPRLREAFAAPVVGDTRNFWVEEYYNTLPFIQKQATLLATGRHGNIWVMDNRITTAQAQTLSAKFDIIYPAATNILGYEYGGGPDGGGGRDGDPKIQILVYDIVNASGTVQAAGYFWAKDHYPSQSGSNQAEMFYIDASQVIRFPDYIYSTLIHEFQHMINFNQKSVIHGKNSAAWYNEMLSMMAEDAIAEKIGITLTNSQHKIRERIPTFLNNYEKVGITGWDSTSNSYAKGIAFGAYLMRNYGGPALLHDILANNAVNVDSITAALDAYSPGLDFEQALRRFGEAMIFSGSPMPAGAMTFDKTVTSTVNRVRYTVYRFDIWDMPRNGGGTGPKIFDVTPINMQPYSLTVHSADEWKNREGNFSITLEEPADENVVLYLMVK